MKLIKYIPFFAFFLFLSCQKEAIPDGQISDSLWLEHKGAQMPILVEGNINSGTLILIIHGGPGGSAKGFNELNKSFSKPMEERYALAYYDQRLSGNSRGKFDEEVVTVAQMVEDLDLVIDLLKDRYGRELNIFLYGVSWGGYLGNAYLSSGNNQEKIQGWIDVAGAHNIEKLTYDGIALMEEVATRQITLNSNEKENWQGILNYIKKFDEETNGRTIKLDEAITLEMNNQAWKAINIARNDNLLATADVVDGTLKAAFFQDHNALTALGNKFHMGGTQLWAEALSKPLTEKLKTITLPSLLLWGKYDFVVSPSLGVEMLAELGTPIANKSLIFFEQSGHSMEGLEMDELVEETINFIEQYK